MPQPEASAGPVNQRQLAVLDLARTAFAAHLFDRFDDQKDAAHPRMIRREPTAVGIDRKIAVESETAAADECAALAALAEAQVFERHQDSDRKRIVDHREIDLGGLYAGALEGELAR